MTIDELNRLHELLVGARVALTGEYADLGLDASVARDIIDQAIELMDESE